MAETKSESKIVASEIKGFYYDSQLNDDYLSITLHPNTVLDKSGNWVGCKTIGLETLKPMQPDINWSAEYRKEPIARCILSEDIQIGVNNNWTDFDGGNAIEGLFNQAKPFAPFLKKMSQGLGEATKGIERESEIGGTIASFLNTGAQWLGKTAGTASEYLNKSLIVQGTRFSYYSGTSVNFGNMTMKYTIFADWIDGKFKTVEDQLEELYPYSIGQYSPYKGGTFNEGEKTGKFLSEYVGWQSPPAGYMVDTLNIDNCLQGTLRMVLGGFYSIENLVLKDISLVRSRTLTKHPEQEGELIPLYADVVLTLGAASMFTDRALTRFSNGSGMDEIRQKLIKKTQDSIKRKEEENKAWMNESQKSFPRGPK